MAVSATKLGLQNKGPQGVGYSYSGSTTGISKNISSVNTYQADILPGARDILTKIISHSGDLSLLGVTDSNNQIHKMIVNYVKV